MNRVSTAGNYSTVLANLLAAQSRQIEAGTQVSSQKVASDLKGYARNAETLTAMRSLQVRVTGFLEQTKQLGDKLTMQDTALNHMAEAAQNARAAIANALANDRADTLMLEMNGAFGDIVEGANTRHQGQYLFAGGQVDTQPTTATNMASLTAAPSVASLFQNGQYVATARLDEATTISTGFLADDIATDAYTAFRNFQTFEEGGTGNFNGALTAAQKTFLEGQLAIFDQVHDDLLAVAGRNGLLQNRAEGAERDLTGREGALAGMIGDLTDVDMAEAVSRLQQAQISVQAASQVFVSLQGASLLDVLRP